MSNELPKRYPVDEEIEHKANTSSTSCYKSVDDEAGGKLVGVYEFVPGSLRRILELGAGWVFEGGYEYMPDTARLSEVTRLANVPIKLVEDVKDANGTIPAEVYGETLLREEVHPVGVGGGVRSYKHDIGSDHFPVVVVAGKSLFELLLPKHRGRPRTFVDIAHAYDRSTMVIRSSMDVFLAEDRHRKPIIDKYAAAEITALIGLSDSKSKVRISEMNKLLRDGLERLEMV